MPNTAKNEIIYFSATKLRELYLKRQLSPVEVTQAILDRIEQINPKVNAFITITYELAIQQAKQAEAAFANNSTPPLLTGIPGSIKDLTPTKGIKTTKGSLLYKDWIPDFDPPIIKRLNEAGMIMLGKTNTPEFGWKGESSNAVFGSTHNPWKLGLTAGGSSGGASAAVATGMGPLSQGSDGAGSIRIPAAFSGVFGFKPSWGLVPHYPQSPIEFLSHLGPITRTVEDSAMMLSAMAGSDPLDRLAVSEPTNYYDELSKNTINKKTTLKNFKIAFSQNLGFAKVDPEVLQLVESAAKNFAKHYGFQIETIDDRLDDPWPIVDRIWSSAQVAMHANDLEQIQDQIDPGRLKVVLEGQKITGAELAESLIERNNYYHQVRQIMQGYDVLITPTLPIEAFKIGLDHPGEINGQPTTYLDWTAFTYPFNVTGQPASSVPCGFTKNNLPVGMQIIGHWRDDITVLKASAAFETAFDWNNKRPNL